jgi:hypothetical protein
VVDILLYLAATEAKASDIVKVRTLVAIAEYEVVDCDSKLGGRSRNEFAMMRVDVDDRG